MGPPETGHDISYALTWNTAGVELGDTGFSLTNNLGIQVQIDTAYLVLYSTQMVACEREESVLGHLFRWFTPRLAHAGHGGRKP